MNSDLTATSTRRRLLGVAAGATGVALAATVLHPAQAAAATPGGGPSTASAGGVRGTTSSGLFADELGTVQQGFLRGADGGDTYADVVRVGGQKHIGPIKYDDFSINFGFGMGQEFERWVVEAVAQNGSRRDGTLLATDFTRTVKSARAFHQALITKLTIPACDASSRTPGSLALTFAAQTATDVVWTGTLTGSPSQQKTWLPSNFRLEINGLDCTRVSKIEAITMTAAPNVDGTPTFEFPNLAITFAASTLSSWKTWFDAFIVSGTVEKSGTLTLLAANSTELAVLRFNNVGIFRLDPDPESATADTIVKARAELYVGGMRFTKLGSYTPTT